MTDFLIALALAISTGLAAWLTSRAYRFGPYLEEDESEALKPPVSPAEEPTTQPSQPPPERPINDSGASRATLEAFCLAIEAYEGGPGDANHRNNNPGNVRFNPGGYLPKYGKVRRSPAGFAIFETRELGMLYLQNMVRQWCKNHPDWTLLHFFSVYAPREDRNDPAKYAQYVGKRLGVDSLTFRLTDLVV